MFCFLFLFFQYSLFSFHHAVSKHDGTSGHVNMLRCKSSTLGPTRDTDGQFRPDEVNTKGLCCFKVARTCPGDVAVLIWFIRLIISVKHWFCVPSASPLGQTLGANSYLANANTGFVYFYSSLVFSALERTGVWFLSAEMFGYVIGFDWCDAKSGVIHKDRKSVV